MLMPVTEHPSLPARYDHVGSFLRPEALLQGKQDADQAIAEVEDEGLAGELRERLAAWLARRRR